MNSVKLANRTIRPLVEGDIADLQRIDAIAHGAPWSNRTFVADIESPDRVHLVAHTSGGSLLGHAAAWITDGSCHVTNVAVAAESAGQGHATALLLALINESLEHHRVLNIQLEVRPANRRAQRLYARFGFVPVGVDRDFYDRDDVQGSRDAVVMVVADVCSDQWRERLAELENEANRQNETAA